ncbi:hypothetical protein C8R43DRAFT_977064 [Mycena crocata]|nr:hypothetical protein C8R43DRAFT_977064 [Mycena crocata]
MDQVPRISVDDLPHEVLTLILKRVADFPIPSLDRKAPFPVVAGRVSHHWRAVALGSPELWTTIRLSHRSQSWSWARVFVERSGMHPLDISINLESYVYKNGQPWREADLPVGRALDIIGPHISRWRSVAFRGWYHQMSGFLEFIQQMVGAASRLESAHFSVVGPLYDYAPVAISNLRVLRLNFPLHRDDWIGFKALRTLDIYLSRAYGINSQSPEFRRIFGPSSTITTLILRDFYPISLHPVSALDLGPINACTIRSFAVSFNLPFYHRYTYFPLTDGFESLTSVFSFPNLESLEVLGGFSGARAEALAMRVPEEWEMSPFPHLRTLRLEDVGFSAMGVAFIQSFSRSISRLELIHTTGNHHLLSAGLWPELRGLTVETRSGRSGTSDTQWLTSFIAMRVLTVSPIQDLVLSPWLLGPNASQIVVDPPPQIRWLHSAPSPALIDGAATQAEFYIDEYDGRAVDFAYVPAPRAGCFCGCDYSVCSDWYGYGEWNLERDLEQTDAAIEEDFKRAAEVVRAKGVWWDARREKRRDGKVRGKRVRFLKKRPRCSVESDFWVV